MTGTVVDTTAAAEAQRDYYLGLLLEEGRRVADAWELPFNEEFFRNQLVRKARTRPGRNPAVDRTRARGQGAPLLDQPDPDGAGPDDPPTARIPAMRPGGHDHR